MDVSSEMIHALLPVFLVGTLGASTEMVGLIEGVGEGTASVIKVFSGWLSDRLGRRKALAVAGYGTERAHQARVRPRARRRLGAGRALRRSRRQGRARRAARRAGGRSGPAGHERGGVRPAPVAGYGRRLRRAAAGDPADGAQREQHPPGVLAGPAARPGGGGAAGGGGARSAAAEASDRWPARRASRCAAPNSRCSARAFAP